MNKRSLSNQITDLALNRNKMAFISGPRQCGKTTLAKSLLLKKENYFNWDSLEFKKTWVKSPTLFAEKILSEQNNPLIILDEFHKNPKWKNQIKGFYDQYSEEIKLLITGSAQLNIYRKGSDSLLGRFVHFSLNPFSLSEIEKKSPISFVDFQSQLKHLNEALPPIKNELRETTNQLFQLSGFPEPLFSGQQNVYNIWSKNRLDLLVRYDIPESSKLLNGHQIDVLSLLMPDKVGSPLSIQSLREDLDVAHTTVSRWLQALNQVYFHFEVSPYSKKIVRSLKKEKKIYLFDHAMIESEGARFENLVALHLKKMIDFYNETGQAQLSLHYLRDKEKNEVDFLVCQKGAPLFSVEAKWGNSTLDKTFLKFRKNYQFPHFQISGNSDVHRFFPTEMAFATTFERFFHQLP